MNPNPLNPPDGDVPAVADAVVKESRGWSTVWLIPLVAALIGVWLAYKTISEKGPLVTIIFQDAAGLEAGKTRIRHKAVEVGVVEAIHLSDDLTHVVVQGRIDKALEPHLGENTHFWLVQPQVGLQGVTGLETLVSGTYIGVTFGGTRPTRSFTALARAPLITPDTPGRQYLLATERLGSLTTGSPIYYRGIQVGEVLDTRLAPDMSSVYLRIFVRAPYDDLVHNDSRFWQVSGVDISMNAQGFNLKMESLAALALGGIAFETPGRSEGTDPSEEGARFALYDSYASIKEADLISKNPFLVYFNGSVRGLSPGAPVEFRGIQIGRVVSVSLQLDLVGKPKIPVVIDLEPQRFLSSAEMQKLKARYDAQGSQQQYPIMEKLVAAGLRAQLQTGSLLTGQLFVNLDYFPDSPRSELIYGGQYPQIPTVPTTLDEFQNSAVDVLNNLKNLPLDKIGKELTTTLQSANRLINDADLKATLRALDATLKDVRQLAQTTDRQIASLAAGAEKTLGSVRATLQSVEPGAPTIVDLSSTLEELANAARSIRALASYLERHPEALIKGKAGVGEKP